MDVVEAYRRAAAGFDARVDAISDEQWANPTPCTEWDVRALVRHLVYEDLWAPPLFEGKTLEEVGDRFEGDILGEHPKEAWKRAYDGALRAITSPGAIERTVHLSYGDDSGEEYLNQLTLDHLVHSWDLARGIGSDERLDADVVAFCSGWVERNREALRASALFAPAIDTPEGADLQTKLLAALGRRA